MKSCEVGCMEQECGVGLVFRGWLLDEYFIPLKDNVIQNWRLKNLTV